MNEYLTLVKQCEKKLGDTLLKKFSRNQTDFECVCFLFKLLQEHCNGKFSDFILSAIRFVNKNYLTGKTLCEQLGVLSAKNRIKSNNGKSDRLSKDYRSQSSCFWNSGSTQEALKCITLSVFYAASPEELSLALYHRSILLLKLGLLEGAIHDGNQALQVRLDL